MVWRRDTKRKRIETSKYFNVLRIELVVEVYLENSKGGIVQEGLIDHKTHVCWIALPRLQSSEKCNYGL